MSASDIGAVRHRFHCWLLEYLQNSDKQILHTSYCYGIILIQRPFFYLRLCRELLPRYRTMKVLSRKSSNNSWTFTVVSTCFSGDSSLAKIVNWDISQRNTFYQLGRLLWEDRRWFLSINARWRRLNSIHSYRLYSGNIST